MTLAVPSPRAGLGAVASRYGPIVAVGGVVVWAVGWADTGRALINREGWPSLSRFFGAALHPELSGAFLALTARSAATTLAYAVLGTALSSVIGLLGAPLLCRRFWEPRGTSGEATRLGSGLVATGLRALAVVPRGIHEVLWALVLAQSYGLTPVVAVIAIGVPFGAVTASVFADTIDEVDPSGYRALRSGGASRLSALVFGAAPLARRDLVAYGCYRFECAIRSAAILGVIGAGGLGFQLALSFKSLEYGEMWTLIAALVALGGVGELGSSWLRRASAATNRAHESRVSRVAIVGFAVSAVAIASWWVKLDVAVLWSSERRARLGQIVGDMAHPRFGPGGFSRLTRAIVDTLAMSVLALAISAVIGLALAICATLPRRSSNAGRSRAASSVAMAIIRTLLLVTRAIPPPVWAFLAILVLFPGVWPGAVALGIYNAGVLGRLFAEAMTESPESAASAVRSYGASGLQAAAYGMLPSHLAQLVALTVYRWEVVVRETIVVGVVGAAGIGRLIQEDLAARDLSAVSSSVIATIALTIALGAFGSTIRRAVR